MIFGQPPREWLRLVFEHQALWRRATLLFITGVITTLLGLTLLGSLFRGAGDPGFSQVGLLAFAFGAVMWVINLAARLTVDPWAAKEMAATGKIPEVYTPITAWTGALFVVYTILTFTALALYGGAALATSLLPGWVGWASIIYGLAGLLLLAASRDAPPFLHYLMPILLGILLLLS
ncbi:MAG TPA: hypothetical protein VFQ25_12395 [Ktedonobacterales bacterium]|nr:hypothetical protein [Ktedonobacterales bacterium]